MFIALLLLAILPSASIIHLIWHRTASQSVEKVVRMLDAQASNTIRAEISSDLAAVSSTAEIARSVFEQNVVEPGDLKKRNSLFRTLMKEQPAIAWVGIAFADGRFYGSHIASTGNIETVEINAPLFDKSRLLRSALDEEAKSNFDVDRSQHTRSRDLVEKSQWYSRGQKSERLAWSVVNTLPLGFEPAIVVSGKVGGAGHTEGVVMVAVSLRRLSAALRSLIVPKGGKIFMLAPSNMVLATSGALDGVMIGHINGLAVSDALATTVMWAQRQTNGSEFHALIDNDDLGPVFVSSNKLPFEDWRLVTAIPRATLAGDIDANGQRVAVVVFGVVIVAAAMAVAFARILFVRPLSHLAEQLKLIGKFEFDSVRHRPNMVAELEDFSLMLKRMSNGVSAFARYLPVDVVRPLIASDVEPKPGGSLCEITVMFADLPGFTELTEEMGAGIEPSLTRFLTVATAAIHAEGGTVDKFIGDAVMAIWNAPVEEPEHALRACRAASMIREAMHSQPAMSPKHKKVRVRIGINTGTALVGNIGSSERLSYTAIGDVVNLASRFVGVAKDHDVEIVLGEETRLKTKGRFAVDPLGFVDIRGKSQKISVYTHTLPCAAS